MSDLMIEMGFVMGVIIFYFLLSGDKLDSKYVMYLINKHSLPDNVIIFQNKKGLQTKNIKFFIYVFNILLIKAINKIESRQIYHYRKNMMAFKKVILPIIFFILLVFFIGTNVLFNWTNTLFEYLVFPVTVLYVIYVPIGK